MDEPWKHYSWTKEYSMVIVDKGSIQVAVSYVRYSLCSRFLNVFIFIRRTWYIIDYTESKCLEIDSWSILFPLKHFVLIRKTRGILVTGKGTNI